MYLVQNLLALFCKVSKRDITVKRKVHHGVLLFHHTNIMQKLLHIFGCFTRLPFICSQIFTYIGIKIGYCDALTGPPQRYILLLVTKLFSMLLTSNELEILDVYPPSVGWGLFYLILN